MSDTTPATLLAITSSVTVFTALLPDFSEVRKASNDPAMTDDVRMGEAAASALVIAIGISASSFTKSPAPAMAAIVFSLGLVFMYETALAANNKEGATNVRTNLRSV